MPDTRRCDVCADDGWYEIWDEVTDEIVANRECPHLGEDWHAPFNARGILPEGQSPAEVTSQNIAWGQL